MPTPPGPATTTGPATALGPGPVAGPGPGVLAAVRVLVERVLGPAAADCDAGEVPAAHVRALAAAGVFGLSGPGVPAAVERAVQEVLAGACAATWFVQVQHTGTAIRVQRAVAGGRSTLTVGQRVWPAADLAASLLAGSVVGGTALADMRREDRPVRAERVPGGWRVTGRVAWYTGWGLNDVMMLGAVADDGSVVMGLVRRSRRRPSWPARCSGRWRWAAPAR